jgi:hypothetical protein
MVRERGFEPPWYCYRQPLKLVRLPVPPLPPGVPANCNRSRYLCAGAGCPGFCGAELDGVAGAAGAGFDAGAGAGGFDCAGVVFAGAGAVVCSRIEPIEAAFGPARFTARAMEVIMKKMAHQVVARDRKVAAPRGPNAVWLPAPPNAPAKSAAVPLCSITTITSTKQTRTCIVTSSVINRQPTATSPTAASIEIAHFAQRGILLPCPSRSCAANSRAL